MLPSLEIKNFRLFKHLQIEHLAQINLITGKNNVGKTTLLEAINIYGHQGSPHVIRKVVPTKNEIEFVNHLFYGYCDNLENIDQIEIQTIPLSGSKQIIINKTRTNFPFVDLRIQQFNKNYLEVKKNNFSSDLYRIQVSDQISHCYFVPSKGIDYNNLCKWWDDMELTPLEDEILMGINIIADNILRISLKPLTVNDNERTFMVRVRNLDTPVSLQSLGGGIDQLFGIILALVNAKEGMLLIDEVENGLHYSIQPDMWNLIFTLAQRLNVQVFATTHSWDCISAFQKAASEHKVVDSQLIHLIKRGDEIRAPFMNIDDLAVATRENIEVR
ncbi:MAG: AAA family ATPase [Candidatus Omnitrophota bacterium]